MDQERLPILSAKYKIPSPRNNYILRKGLQKELKEIDSHKVTIVKAGAGSGKTTLLSVFIREQKLSHVKWITLDASTNQMLVFFSYIFYALEGEITGNSEDLKSSFESTVPINMLQQMLALFADRLTTQYDIYLVLDDFQNITDSTVLSTLHLFLESVPDTFHLIILSRTMPEIGVGALYMEGSLFVIDEEEMRLTKEECRMFLVQTLGMKEETNEIMRIVKEANGWIGGAQLMAVAEKVKKERYAAFASADELLMFDYIEKEIFSSLSEEEQLFLEKTGVLSYFNEQICERYLPEYQFTHMMRQITEKNLFVIQMEEEKQEYRYHAILREFLLKRLARNQKRKVVLFEKAADVMYEYQDYGECVRLLQEVKSYKKLMEVLLLMPQNSETFGYMMQVPLEEIKNNPNFAYQYFFCYYAILESEKCEEIYDYIKEQLKDDVTFQGFKHANLFFDINWEFRNVTVMSYEQIKEMPLNEITKAYLLIKEAYFLFLADEIPRAFLYLDKVEEIYHATGNIYIRLFELADRSQMLEEYGEFKRAHLLYREMKTTINEVPTMKASYYIGIAGLYIRQMRLKEAELALDEADKTVNHSFETMNSAYLYTLAEWYYVSGEAEKTIKIISGLANEKLYQGIFFSARLLRYPIYRGNNKKLAEMYLTNYENSTNQQKNMDTAILYIGIYYELKDRVHAMEMLDELLGRARKIRNKLKIVECSLMKARFLYETGKEKNKMYNLLKEGLAYARGEEIRVPFWFEKEFLEQLMKKRKEELEEKLSKDELSYITQCITNQVDTTQIKEKEEMYGLTQRELEVAEEMKKGNSNKVIADHLCISMATVKTHLINIYSKLGVKNRVAAVHKLEILEIGQRNKE